MNNNDWRLTNQINYLFRKKLIKGGFKPYREGWEHEHCEFCAERIDNTTAEAYSTEDRYHWICKECYNDFKDMFEWEVCNYDNNFYDEHDLIDCLNRGCEVEFSYNEKMYSITHTGNGISITEFYNEDSEKTYPDALTALSYEIDGKPLRDIISKMKVVDRSF